MDIWLPWQGTDLGRKLVEQKEDLRDGVRGRERGTETKRARQTQRDREGGRKGEREGEKRRTPRCCWSLILSLGLFFFFKYKA